jgi:hypothetical protein
MCADVKEAEGTPLIWEWPTSCTLKTSDETW